MKKNIWIFVLCFISGAVAGCVRAPRPRREKPIPHVKLASGEFHSCAIVSTGGVMCWGANDSGQLGNGKAGRFSKPVSVRALSKDARALSAGSKHTCALFSSGNVKCWGKNDRGQLGNGTRDDSALPVDVDGIQNAMSLSAGSKHACAVLESGRVKCWGANDFGQLGDGTIIDRVSSVGVTGLENAKFVSAGDYHTCALLSSGKIKCWGMNYHGELGIGTNIGPDSCGAVSGTYACSKEPVDVMSINKADFLSAGASHACAADARGKMMCWGSNWDGQLGAGEKLWIDVCGAGLLTSPCATSPVNVKAEFSSVRALSAGGAHTCAIVAQGRVACWGANDYGQLGDETQKGKVKPQNVSGLTNVQFISAGSRHTCAHLSTGEIKCWGANGYGQLGVVKKSARKKCKNESCSTAPVNVEL